MNVARALTRWAGGLGVVIFAAISFQIFFSDSEIWSITLGAHWLEDFKHPWVMSRPLFYSLLGIFEFFARNESQTYLAARALFVLNGILILFLVFQITRRLSFSRDLTPYLAVLLLVSHGGFIAQGARVRSDLLAATLSLAYLLWAVIPKVLHERALKTRYLLLGFFAPLLATPKAIFQVLSFLVFAPSLFREEWLQSKWKAAVRLGLGGALLAVVIALTWRIYEGSFSYFLQSFSAGYGTPSYLSRKSFLFLTALVKENPVFDLLFLARVVTWAVRQKRSLFQSPLVQRLHLLFGGYVGAALVFVIFAPEKLPFFLASYLPVFCIFTSLLFSDLKVLFARYPRRIEVAAAVFALGFWLQLIHLSSRKMENNSNHQQLAAVDILDGYLAWYPYSTVFDGIGILPKRTSIRSFVGPNQVGANQVAFEHLKREPTDFVLYVTKLIFLETELTAFLNSEYLHLGNGIHARAYSLDQIRRAGRRQVTWEIQGADGSTSIQVRKATEPPAGAIRFSPFLAPEKPLPAHTLTLFRFDGDA